MKSNAITWLEELLGFSVVMPLEQDTLQSMRQQFNQLVFKEVVIFGAGSGGSRMQAILAEKGITTSYFIDNFATGELNNAPVYSPLNMPNDNLPVILASTWFVDIIQQVKTHENFINRPLFVLPDSSFLTTNIYDDMVGYCFYQTFEKRLADYQKVYHLLEDDYSKQVFLKVLAYRLGFFSPLDLDSAHLPKTSKEYQETARAVPRLPAGFEAPLARATTECFAHPHYIIDGYSGPKAGNHVFDCGAWEGDTAYWYLHHVGSSGKVYAFEPSNFNCERMKTQLASADADYDLHIEKVAIGSHEHTQYWDDIVEAGTCSRLTTESTKNKIDVISLDYFVEQHNVEKLDIIKTDLEGADFAALEGAVNTIRKFKPDLAISIYHTADQMVDIPLWIHHHFPDYRLRLNHNHMGVNETICIATTQPSS